MTNLSIAAHVYDSDLRHLADLRLINCNLDTRGYFIITIENNGDDIDKKQIHVSLMNSNNELVESWHSMNVHDLCDRCQMFISDVSHALYMGRELSRAYQCLIDNVDYIKQ